MLRLSHRLNVLKCLIKAARNLNPYFVYCHLWTRFVSLLSLVYSAWLVATPTHQLTVYLQLYYSRSPEYCAPSKWDSGHTFVRPSGTRLDTTQDHSSPTVLECGPRSYFLSRGVQAVPVNVSAPDSRVARDVDLQCYRAALGDSHRAVHSNHCRVA